MVVCEYFDSYLPFSEEFIGEENIFVRLAERFKRSLNIVREGGCFNQQHIP